MFGSSELKGATRDFSEENIIGRCGSATVYKVIYIRGFQIVFWCTFSI